MPISEMPKDPVKMAINLAAKVHEGDYRKHPSDLPYISHSVMVGIVLSRYNASENAIVAGILHDVIEEARVEYDDIASIFGETIAEIVGVCTEDKSVPWKERNVKLADGYRTASRDAKMVALADKWDSLTSYLDSALVSPSFWSLFAGTDSTDKDTAIATGKSRQMWKMRTLLIPLAEDPNSVRNEPLYQKAAEIYEAIFGEPLFITSELEV